MSEVANLLEVKRFAVLGASGGAPHALGAARKLGDRVSCVGIVAGVAPPGTPGMDRSVTIRDEVRSPFGRRAKYAASALAARVRPDWLVERTMAGLAEEDRAALSAGSCRAPLRRIVSEAFAQGGRAAARETGQLLTAWDFDPASVQQEVMIWHGANDNRIPAEAAGAMAALIPTARSVIWPRHGHFSWAMSDSVREVVEYFNAAHPDGPGR